MKKYSKFFLIPAFLSAVFIACNKDKEMTNISPGEQVVTSERGNSAAAHISASEKLVIPAAVDLPASQPNGNSRVATYFAIGVQKYKAQVKAGSSPVSYEWAFVAPQADLYDATNATVGNHGAGPYWQLSPVDSIFAQHFSPARTAPSPDAGSIDWLLLKPKTGTTPTGIFAGVDYIQRIATQGGKAPAILPVSANETVEVKYKTVYRFSKINP